MFTNCSTDRQMSGIPAYFPPMLMDRDRNYKYKAAIEETVRSFIEERG